MQTKPQWIVYVDKKGNLQASLTNKDIPEKDILGYVASSKPEEAIAYCESMGFREHHYTDHRPMSPVNRGEILFFANQKLSLLTIAERTNRSISWVSIVCGISGRDREELIRYYLRDKENQDEGKNRLNFAMAVQSTTSKKQEKADIRVSGVPHYRPDKTVYPKRTRKSVPKYKTKRYNSDSGHTDTGSNSVNTRKQRIIDGLRDAKDYKGE